MLERKPTKGGVLTREPRQIIEFFPMRRQHLDYSMRIALSHKPVITLRRIGLVRSVDVGPTLQTWILMTNPFLICEGALRCVNTGAKRLDQANRYYQ